MNSARITLRYAVIVGLVGMLASCGDATLLTPGGEEAPGATQRPDGTHEEPESSAGNDHVEIGEIHTFAFEPDESQPDFEADPATNGLSLPAEAPFLGVKVSFVSPAPSLEYQLVYEDGTEDDWQDLVPDFSQDERSHRGFLNAAQLSS